MKSLLLTVAVLPLALPAWALDAEDKPIKNLALSLSDTTH
jgi:hypothetical protein